MKKTTYRIPDLSRESFAQTNIQTIQQRISIIQELFPETTSIAEICCGNCSQQSFAYQERLNIGKYAGLDIHPGVVEMNRSRGIKCVLGDALDRETLAKFINFDLVFFGPPLSKECDGHHLLSFQEITPGYWDFSRLLLAELAYKGIYTCICPKSTTMGDIEQLYKQIQEFRPDVGLRLVHSSYSTLTGGGETTEPRLKYVELWFSSNHPDWWEVRESRG